MKMQQSNIGMAAIMAALLFLTASFAFAEKDKKQPMKPELAAKKEMVRKQHEQRVTDSQRKTSSDALKAERIKIYKAKEHVKRSKPHAVETK